MQQPLKKHLTNYLSEWIYEGNDMFYGLAYGFSHGKVFANTQ